MGFKGWLNLFKVRSCEVTENLLRLVLIHSSFSKGIMCPRVKRDFWKVSMSLKDGNLFPVFAAFWTLLSCRQVTVT